MHRISADDDNNCAQDVSLHDDELQNYDISPILLNTNNNVVTRRSSIASALGSLSAASFIPTEQQFPAAAATTNEVPSIPSLTIPLQYQPKLSAYTISYKVGKSSFGAIIDTGSPFLLVPHPDETWAGIPICSPDYKWGCLGNDDSRPSGLQPTLERFDGNEGLVEWREGKFSFDLTMNDNVDVGVAKGKNDKVSSSSGAANTVVGVPMQLAWIMMQQQYSNRSSSRIH